MLLEAAPAAALAEANGGLPLAVALDQATHNESIFHDRARYLETARLLLPASPPEATLAALKKTGKVALPLFADLVACTALSPEQWQRMPPAVLLQYFCPGLAAALPAVLARSVLEAALLMEFLPFETCRRLRIGALCLGRAQRVLGVELPAALVGQVLALAAGP